MRVNAFSLFIFTCLCVGLFTLSPDYAAGNDTDAMIETVKGVIAAEKENAPSDSAFKFNPGVEALKTGANKAFGEDSAAAKYFRGSKNKNLNKLGETIPEKTLDGLVESHFYPEAANVKEYEKKVKSKQKTLEKIKKKNQANQALSDALEKDKNLHAKNLQNLSKQEVNASAFEKKRIKKQIKAETRRFNSASAAQKRVNRRIAQSGMTKATKQLTAFEKKLLNARKSASYLRNAMARKASFDKKNLLVGAVLTAVSSHLEENALAKKQGRPPRTSNTLWNFAKNMSGYSTVLGVMESAELAKLEAFVEAAEFYKKNGFDINDPEVQAKIEASVRRAVQKQYLYEGAKLAPVVGDLINIKEAAAAGTDAVVAIEELSYIRASNKQEQFQMGLTTAIKADAKVKEMEKIVEQTNQLAASLGKLKAQLLNMEKAAAVNREKISQAIQTLEAYNEQAQALQNPSVASSLDEANTEALLARLNAIKASADQQIGNMTRVKSEHASGELTPQGVANQTKFIGDLLQPSVDDYTNLQPTLSGIEAIGKGAELAAQAPQALELLRQGKGVMLKEAQRTDDLYATYREQAGNLKELSDRFKTLKQDLAKNQAFLDTSSNLEQVHRERIRAAVARSRDIDINKNAITQAIEDARGLRNSAEMVSALAALDKTPPAVDTSQANAMIEKAQQAWGKLSGVNLAAAESLQKAQGLLNELVALAGDVEPTDLTNKNLLEGLDPISHSKLFANKNWMQVSPKEIEHKLENLNQGKAYAYTLKDFFNYLTYDFPEGVTPREYCQTIPKDYCPPYDQMYRVLEEGNTTVNYGLDTNQASYWITNRLTSLDVDFISEFDPMPSLEESQAARLDIEHARKRAEKVEVVRLAIPRADEAIAVHAYGESWTWTHIYARIGPIIYKADGELECQTLSDNPYNEHHLRIDPHIPSAIKQEEHVTSMFEDDFLGRCLEWHDKREVIMSSTLVEPVFMELYPIVKKQKENIYFQSIDFNFGYPDLTADYHNYGKTLKYNRSISPKLTKQWKRSVRENYSVNFSENYHVRVMNEGPSPSESWEDVFSRIHKQIDLRHKNKSNTKNMEILEGISATFSQPTNRSSKSDTYTRYQYREDIDFRIDNIWVSIFAAVDSDTPGTRTIEIAKDIARQINRAPKGWK